MEKTEHLLVIEVTVRVTKAVYAHGSNWPAIEPSPGWSGNGWEVLQTWTPYFEDEQPMLFSFDITVQDPKITHEQVLQELKVAGQRPPNGYRQFEVVDFKVKNLDPFQT